jgi:glucose uptake protein
MYLPDTYLAALLLIVFSILCWGSWANLLKLGGWRFELFYYDFAWGALLCAAIAAFTFGMLNPKELTFQENPYLELPQHGLRLRSGDAV